MDDFTRDVIREFYPQGGSVRCAPLLPHLSLAQIRNRAKRMGVKAPTHGKTRSIQVDVSAEASRAAHRVWQLIDRTIPAANDGPLIARIAA